MEEEEDCICNQSSEEHIPHVLQIMYKLHPMGCTFVTYAHVHKAHGQP